jgi:hypothetical protein
MLNKKIGLILVVFAFAFFIIGFIYEGIFAGIPYQDPTPELYKKYMHYVNVGQLFYKVGTGVLALGILTISAQKVFRFLKNNRLQKKCNWRIY